MQWWTDLLTASVMKGMRRWHTSTSSMSWWRTTLKERWWRTMRRSIPRRSMPNWWRPLHLPRHVHIATTHHTDLIKLTGTGLDLLSQKQEFLDHLFLLLQLPILNTLIQLFLPFHLDSFIKSAFHFGDDIRHMLRKTQLQWLTIKIASLELLNSRLSLILIRTHHKSLPAHFDIFLGMNLQHIDAHVAEQLKYGVF